MYSTSTGIVVDRIFHVHVKCGHTAALIAVFTPSGQATRLKLLAPTRVARIETAIESLKTMLYEGDVEALLGG